MGGSHCCARRPIRPFPSKFSHRNSDERPHLIYLETAENVPKGSLGYMERHTSLPSPYVIMWVEAGGEANSWKRRRQKARQLLRNFSNLATWEEDCNQYQNREIEIERKNMKKTIRIPELIVQSWPVRHQCVQGIWKSTKPLTTISGRTDPKRDILHIAVFDYSHPNGEDIVGYTSLKISELAQKSKLRVKVPLAYDPIPFFPADLSVTLKLAAPPPQRKTIFLLRHAKSIWNRAQETDLGVSAVFSEDHPLHEEGIKQAESLRTQIRVGYACECMCMRAPSPATMIQCSWQREYPDSIFLIENADQLEKSFMQVGMSRHRMGLGLYMINDYTSFS